MVIPIMSASTIGGAERASKGSKSRGCTVPETIALRTSFSELLWDV